MNVWKGDHPRDSRWSPSRFTMMTENIKNIFILTADFRKQERLTLWSNERKKKKKKSISIKPAA